MDKDCKLVHFGKKVYPVPMHCPTCGADYRGFGSMIPESNYYPDVWYTCGHLAGYRSNTEDDWWESVNDCGDGLPDASDEILDGYREPKKQDREVEEKECVCGRDKSFGTPDPYKYIIHEAGLRSEHKPRTFELDVRRITGITPRGYCSFVPYFILGEGRYTLLEVHTIDGTYNIAYGTDRLQSEALTLLRNHWKWGKGNQL